MWSKLKSWSWHSLTMGWAYALVVAPEVLNALPAVVDFVGAPEVAKFVAVYMPASWVLHYTAVLGLVTAVARLRSLLRK